MKDLWRGFTCLILFVILCFLLTFVQGNEGDDDTNVIVCVWRPAIPAFFHQRKVCVSDSRFYDVYCCYQSDGVECCERWKTWVIIVVTCLAVIAIIGIIAALIACCCGCCSCFQRDKPKDEEKQQIIIEQYPRPERPYPFYTTNEQVLGGNGTQRRLPTAPTAPPPSEPLVARPPPYREY